jgi:hypothetical protein
MNTEETFSLWKAYAGKLLMHFVPVFLLVVGEGEPVHPLNFHMVYHNKLAGYLFDAQKILQIRAVGDGYFYEGRYYEFDPSYSSLDAPYEAQVFGRCYEAGIAVGLSSSQFRYRRKVEKIGP